jgi:hypothetical protein
VWCRIGAGAGDLHVSLHHSCILDLEKLATPGPSARILAQQLAAVPSPQRPHLWHRLLCQAVRHLCRMPTWPLTSPIRAAMAMGPQRCRVTSRSPQQRCSTPRQSRTPGAMPCLPPSSHSACSCGIPATTSRHGLSKAGGTAQLQHPQLPQALQGRGQLARLHIHRPPHPQPTSVSVDIPARRPHAPARALTDGLWDATMRCSQPNTSEGQKRCRQTSKIAPITWR